MYGQESEEYKENVKKLVKNIFKEDVPIYDGDMPKWENRVQIQQE